MRPRISAFMASFGLLCALVPGQPPSGAAEAVEPPALTGRILAFDGTTPAPGVVVTLTDPATGEAHGSLPAGETGDFRIEGVPDGEYLISLSLDGWSRELPGPVGIAGLVPRSLTLILPREAPVQVPEGGPVPRGRGGAARVIAVGGGVAGLVLAVVANSDDEETGRDRDVSPKRP